VSSLGLLKQKEGSGYAVDGAHQFIGTDSDHQAIWNKYRYISCIL